MLARRPADVFYCSRTRLRGQCGLVPDCGGARKTWLVDTGPYASRDVALYKKMAQELKSEGVSAPDISQARSFEDIVTACRGEYVTRGLESLRAIPSESVDFI